MSPRSWNASLYYDDGTLMLRASVTTRSKIPQAVPGATPSNDVDGRTAPRNVDFSASYKISKVQRQPRSHQPDQPGQRPLAPAACATAWCRTRSRAARSWSARGWTSKRIVLRSSFRLLDRPQVGRHVCRAGPASAPTHQPSAVPCRSAIGGSLLPGTPMLTQILRLCARPRCPRAHPVRAGRAHRHRHGQQWQLLFAG